jgi:serine/threonine protein phosphatase 1
MNQIHQKWVRFAKNEIGRDFVVGDIHGWFNVAYKNMENLKFDPEKDRLFCLGDLIDRGPYSKDVLKWLDQKSVYSIKGNHEQMMYEFFHGIDWKIDYPEKHGGKWFTELPMYEQMDYVDRLRMLPHVAEIETIHGLVGLVHAEVPHDWEEFKNNYKKYEDDALWSFNKFNLFQIGISYPVKNIDWVIHGHVSVDHPTMVENKIYIDTGAATRKLTFLEINCQEGIRAYHA